MEAEPRGWSSKEANSSETGLPRCFSIWAWTVSASIGATLERSLARASAYSGGRYSDCCDAIWPILTKVGPRSWMMPTTISGVMPSS